MIRKIMMVLLYTGLLSAPVKSQSWQNGVFLNYSRAGAAATGWNGKIYVFGGKSINNKVLNNVEVFDPISNTWDTTAVPSFQQARYNASICVWANKFYLTGGRTLNGALKSMEVYDPVMNSWSEAQDLRRIREGHTANYFNGRVYIIGGQSDSDNLIEDIEWYDFQDEQWKEALFALPYPRSAHFFAIDNDDFYLFGGYYYGLTNTIYKATKEAEGYSWQQIDTLSEKRAYGITAQIDSLVYLIGGETENGKTNLVEIYNLNRGQLETGESMNMSHSGMTSAVLNKKIYSIGGYEAFSNEPVNHVHVFTPAVTSIADPPAGRPQSAIIANAYPNPFNGQINIQIKLSERNDLAIQIFNISGQLLHSAGIAAKAHIVYKWNATDQNNNEVPSGIYFALIKSGHQQKVVKLTYVK